MSIYGDIEKAIRERLAANWPYAVDVPIVYENMADPAKPAPFIYLSIHFVDSRQVGMGTGAENRKYRQTGLIMIGIYTKKNEGPGVATQYADALANIFRGQTFGGVVCLAPVTDRGRPADDEGNYWLKTLTCEFYSDALA